MNALHAIRKAGLVPALIGHDTYVTSAEIAERAGVSHQAVYNLFKGKETALFPTSCDLTGNKSPTSEWPEVSERLEKKITGAVTDQDLNNGRQISRLDKSIVPTVAVKDELTLA